MKYKNTKTL